MNEEGTKAQRRRVKEEKRGAERQEKVQENRGSDKMDKSQLQPRQELIRILKDFFEEKAAAFNIDMAFLYGSWASGYPREDSEFQMEDFSLFGISWQREVARKNLEGLQNA